MASSCAFCQVMEVLLRFDDRVYEQRAVVGGWVIVSAAAQ